MGKNKTIQKIQKKTEDKRDLFFMVDNLERNDYNNRGYNKDRRIS